MRFTDVTRTQQSRVESKAARGRIAALLFLLCRLGATKKTPNSQVSTARYAKLPRGPLASTIYPRLFICDLFHSNTQTPGPPRAGSAAKHQWPLPRPPVAAARAAPDLETLPVAHAACQHNTKARNAGPGRRAPPQVTKRRPPPTSSSTRRRGRGGNRRAPIATKIPKSQRRAPPPPPPWPPCCRSWRLRKSYGFSAAFPPAPAPPLSRRRGPLPHALGLPPLPPLGRVLARGGPPRGCSPGCRPSPGGPCCGGGCC